MQSQAQVEVQARTRTHLQSELGSTCFAFFDSHFFARVRKTEANRAIQYNPVITVLKGLANLGRYWRAPLLVGNYQNKYFLPFEKNIQYLHVQNVLIKNTKTLSKFSFCKSEEKSYQSSMIWSKRTFADF